MRIAIRTDSSAQVGVGHGMRCLALAVELRARGTEVCFIMRDLPGSIHALIRSHGFTVSMLRAGQDGFALPPEDAANSVDALLRMKWRPDWVIVDHYGADALWEKQLASTGARIFIIDDLADRCHVGDLLLDQNYHADMMHRYDGILPDHCRRLVGPRFALLRREFAASRRLSHIRTKMSNVLVFFGGTDPSNQTSKALDALDCPELREVKIDVVMGNTAPHISSVRRKIKSMSHATLHVQSIRLAELMTAADLSLGAGGSSTWERLCVGLPTLVVSVAQNQELIAASLHRENYIDYLGRDGEVSIDLIRRKLQSVLIAPQWLETCSARAFELVDGMGIRRVADVIDGRM